MTFSRPPWARVAASPLRLDRRLAARPTHRARPPPPALFGPWQPALGSGSGVRSVPVPARPSPVPGAAASAACFVSTGYGPGWPSADLVTHFRRERARTEEAGLRCLGLAPGLLEAASSFRPETPPSPNQSPDNTVEIHNGLLGALPGWELFHA